MAKGVDRKTLVYEWPAHDARGVPVVYRFYREDINNQPYYSVHAVGDTKWMTHGQSFRAIAPEFERLIKEKANEVCES